MNALDNDLAAFEINPAIEATPGQEAITEVVDPRDGDAFTQDTTYSEDPAGN
jgi:hypothetical protein